MASSVACVSIRGHVKEVCREQPSRLGTGGKVVIRSCAYVFPLGCDNPSINPGVLLVLARIQIAKSGAGGRHAIRPKYGNESRDRLMAIETRSGEVMAPGRPILMGSDQRQASATVLLCRAGSH